MCTTIFSVVMPKATHSLLVLRINNIIRDQVHSVTGHVQIDMCSSCSVQVTDDISNM
eukprot:m.36113 g.36113  ORF g.36113 m.36113 type:complete len:57 (+) comp7530_c0_seq2:1993-2163(+)